MTFSPLASVDGVGHWWSQGRCGGGDIPWSLEWASNDRLQLMSRTGEWHVRSVTNVAPTFTDVALSVIRRERAGPLHDLEIW
jgi:hypothetical protein